ncbi:MAG: hypothetical protein GVY07_05005 [Bacteroidetes bacterium]|jgi:hypothetical protein|nr:hypothetical protein [Bacteroidota bacterium]
MEKLDRFTIYWIATFLVLSAFLMSCSGAGEIASGPNDRGYYKNHLQSQEVRDDIKKGFRSVVRIQNNVIYRTYQFYTDDLPLRSELEGVAFGNVAAQTYLEDQSTAGTAVVLSEFRGKFAMLTAAHTVFYPDTVWHYHSSSNNQQGRYVEAVSVRESVNYILLNEKGVIKLDLVTYDSNRDLAVMTNVEAREDLMTPLSLSMGESDELEWGDIVYALGYPKGAQMVTMGTASRSDHPTRSILIDASFNRGFSGGALFAVRNDGSGLEFIGVVTSALGESETYLAPVASRREAYDPDVPYTGEIFVKTAPRINYGITNAVDSEEVKQFLRENEEQLNNYGVVLPRR